MTVETQPAEREEYARFLKDLGVRIRVMRKERGWTYRDMVVQFGFHLSAWQGFEAGRFGMSLPSLLRVARTFGMHPSELIAGLDVGQTSPAPTAESVGASPPSKSAKKITRTRVGAKKRG